MAKKNLSKKLSSERSAKPQRQKKRRRALSSTVLLPYKKMGPIWQMLGGPDEGMPIDIPQRFKFGPEYVDIKTISKSVCLFTIRFSIDK